MGAGASSSNSKVVPDDCLARHNLDVSTLLVLSQSRNFSCEEKPPSDGGPTSEGSSAPPADASEPTGPSAEASACGELYLALERVDAVSGQSIFVRAFVNTNQAGEDVSDSSPIGCVAEWPSRSCSSSPSWFSARPLGLRDVQYELDDVALRMELWNRQRLLGSFTAPLSELGRNVRETRSFSSTASENFDECTVSFQVVDAALVLERHSVFFIRHAESIWNEAQRKRHFRTMASTKDHSLSSKGCLQSQDLQRRLRACAERCEADVEPMLQPDAVFVSPLTRAVQTAVIALGPSLARPGRPCELMLMAAAREKQNRGGLDTRSLKLAEQIPEHVLKELHAEYPTDTEYILDMFRQVRFDVQDVQDRWWFEGAAESELQLCKRLEEFVAQLLYSPHRSIIVVGHSHFFRALMRGFLCDDFKQRCSDTAHDLTDNKLQNCGVVRFELDTSRGILGKPIVDATMVLRSQTELIRARTTSLESLGHTADQTADPEFDEDELQDQPDSVPHAQTTMTHVGARTPRVGTAESRRRMRLTT